MGWIVLLYTLDRRLLTEDAFEVQKQFFLLSEKKMYRLLLCRRIIFEKKKVTSAFFSICKQPSAWYRKMNKFHSNGSIFLVMTSLWRRCVFFVLPKQFVQSDLSQRRQKQIITIRYVSIEILSVFGFFPHIILFVAKIYAIRVQCLRTD